MSYPKTSNANGAMLQKLKWDKIMSATALCSVLSLTLSILWHHVLFEKQYQEIGYPITKTASSSSKNSHTSDNTKRNNNSDDTTIFAFNLISSLLQNFIHCFAFALVKLISKSSISLQFLRTWIIPLFGLYHWAFYVVAAVNDRYDAGSVVVDEMSGFPMPRLVSVVMFLLMESVYEVSNFAIVALIVGFTV